MQETPSGGDEAVTFSRELTTMKRRGSNLLVVGPGVGTPHLAACHNLLGDAGTRRRLLVRTNDGPGLEERCPPADCDQSTVRVIDCPSTTRSVAATQSTPTPPPRPVSARTDAPIDDLPSLGATIGREIDRIETETGGLDPAQLRVCVTALSPLVDEHDERAIFRFIHAVTDDVRRVSGMGHYHLGVPHSAEVVQVLAPLFDAVVEVRGRRAPEQRWHLQDRQIRTDWLAL